MISFGIIYWWLHRLLLLLIWYLLYVWNIVLVVNNVIKSGRGGIWVGVFCWVSLERASFLLDLDDLCWKLRDIPIFLSWRNCHFLRNLRGRFTIIVVGIDICWIENLWISLQLWRLFVHNCAIRSSTDKLNLGVLRVGFSLSEYLVVYEEWIPNIEDGA